MTFSLIIFYWSAMDGHPKREVLELFNMMNEKNVITRYFFLNLLPICQLFKSFSKMVTWHITRLINTISKIL